MLLKGQEAASSPAWKSVGNKPSVAEKHSPGKSLRQVPRAPGPARLTDWCGKQSPKCQLRLYNLSQAAARFFYLPNFLIGSQFPEGN